jgi:hypothetical protein
MEQVHFITNNGERAIPLCAGNLVKLAFVASFRL